MNEEDAFVEDKMVALRREAPGRFGRRLPKQKKVGAERAGKLQQCWDILPSVILHLKVTSRVN